ncbi:MAG: hypothetical protein ABSC53_08575 [Bacteroidota bacterium]|jgi:hypothetical protein
METTLVESKKSYRHGFILTEQELRRLIDVIHEQLSKANSVEKISDCFLIKYRNGIVAETHSIDEVVQQDNTGSRQIVYLQLKSDLGKAKRSTRIIISLIEANEKEEGDSVTIRQRISGASRDWVFVTSSLIEERILKIKRFSPNQILSSTAFSFFSPIAIALILMFSILFYLPSLTERGKHTADLIEQKWKSGQLKDPIEAIIMTQRTTEDMTLLTLFKPGIYIIAALIIIYLLFRLVMRYYPIYNFCWGDYLQQFNQKESRRKFILGGILLALIISIAGSLIASRLGQ